MDSLIFELQIVFYFQLFLSANVRHNIVKEVIHRGLNMMTYFSSFSHDPENSYSLSPCGCYVSGFHLTVELIGSERNSS